MRKNFWQRRFAAAVLMSAMCQWSFAEDACLLTRAEFQAATGRAFAAGQPGVATGSGEPLCHYAEVEQPKRRLTIGVITEKAQQRFEATKRLLKYSKPIELTGVGDAAYLTGTGAGVLSGNRFIYIAGLRRGASNDPKVTAERARELLQRALERASDAQTQAPAR